ncbi:uncharacterized protein MONOS_11961 [Monocercomonoides exilis]|uniref:uncharacterized protein n=1 Tax=Monocercomonoides exilis TaxID=2049356 RepID=UPI0035593CEA|nr:hypothetical protein MONOS_11961 [Monocercomonoides exilis]|eukprot:MONOS_11961.1-p1 / transcript=MONOS_11961.1 / gene=MONOS_11961 / organism=Monocercomonoides_exilis_PA203 / gene_product=unspecified product / transcript_product=unspecified product / location=Mono_scaffold00631:4897-5725(-) / protein_length=234 / sequence_SO=supercontig / SO=protein_coding / is_pseudo=false
MIMMNAANTKEAEKERIEERVWKNSKNELKVLLEEIILAEGMKLEKLMKRLYHLLKIIDPHSSNHYDYKTFISFKKKLKEVCGNLDKPIELLAARVLGYSIRIVCFDGDLTENDFSKDIARLSKPAQHLAMSIPFFHTESMYDIIEDELAELGKCKDEDICLLTLAYLRAVTIDYGATPYIGEYEPAKIGEWLYGLLSNSIPSVIMEALEIVKELSTLKIILDLSDGSNYNSL